MRTVDPEFFTIMHIRLKAGRFFTAGDTASSRPVAVVSESYGRLLFGSDNPIGRSLDLQGREVEIVGIAGDARYSAATSEAAPAFYLPRAQHPSELICLVVEPVPGTEASVIAGLRDAVRSLDRTQPIAHITTIDQIVSDSTADRRFYAVTTGAFAAVALLLAIAGIFGTVFRIVAERQRDFAIRVALAADPRRLLRLVCGYGVSPALAGTTLGLGAAYAGSRLLRSFLFEIAPTDWLTSVGAVVLIMGVTSAAGYVPARRALRVEPMFVLRSD